MTPLVNDATRAQQIAARPDASTWLTANAGSGKTRVLTDRVARLLLRKVEPQNILCLTYTKAAASEMQNRLFERLGAWAMLDDAPLRDALKDLGVDDRLDAAFLAHARTLFALAIETPGGLKIQTIHSFCAGLLRRFPLEAKVNPQFQEIEDRAAELLRAEVIDDMIGSPEGDVVIDLMSEFTGVSIAGLAGDMLRLQELFSPERSWEDIAQAFDLEHMPHPALTQDDLDLLTRALPLCLEGGDTDRKLGAQFHRVIGLDTPSLSELSEALLVKGPPRALKKRLVNKATADALGPDFEALQSLAERVLEQHEAQLRTDMACRTSVLHRFAYVFLARYAEAKQARGWLDFDDLILHTRALLTDPKVADWVLFRLDGGIEHVLVDEAQDTSPAQWDVIRKLTQEFTSGQGIETDTPRTLFVVGDKKQSIYSFQGADPDAFDQMQIEFGEKIRAIGAAFQDRSLAYSFRSAGAILQLVDHCFDSQVSAGFTDEGGHKPFHSELPGRVDLWPVVPESEDAPETHWTDPIDRQSTAHHTVVFAELIAKQIKKMLAEGRIPERASGSDAGYHLRPVRPGDIMILVQRRSALFHEIIRACKTAGLPVAGADRLKVGAELAVRDLLALLSFLATPDDSLSLAACLRSPLFGWSEDDLFKLAHGRTEPHLWQALRKQPERYPDTFAILKDLRDRIDFLRPFDLLERILTRHHGRARLLARLGPEAQDGIDALLTQAVGYERSAVPSLTGFLIWAQADELTIKRQMSSSADLIRVMTVHGAKGLEAPIVILPDSGQRQIRLRDDLATDGDLPIWRPARENAPERMRALNDAAREREMQERLRLLYVAMTRAETWLIVGAAGALDAKEDWYQRVEQAMGRVGAAEHAFDGGTGLRFETGSWNLPGAPQNSTAPTQDPEVPSLFRTPLTTIPKREKPLSPSDLGGPKALPAPTGLPDAIATARGSYVHKLLEELAPLPRATWPARMRILRTPPELSEALVAECQAEAERVLSQPALSWIFAADTLAEVPVHGEVNSRPFFGIIDRLIIDERAVTLVDYKTNLTVPDRPEDTPIGILRQMGAYAALLEQIYPEKDIKTGILWTRTAQFMSLPHSLVIDAVAHAPLLDVTEPRS